ncbi:MAG: hypothetical protein OZ913_08775 [Ignavibacteriaceae bacterium]|jgi:Capsule polysaccharide export protein|nr:MAG: hypothetical protein EDM69_09085 [Chlorobiota bacterium]KXK03202.1 MAG: Polysaccharide biosynthesis protein [Chlorobi bacterium OLB4]MBV6399660.1 hypothetical protein [Ignavibacteria bacterium]MCC6885652.1 hypothetical protein [Ignavibacteriales bacterium]MCE7953816.1 hypothetical protein [Chlorobi bacterium CHB7]MDL1887750.1 hypothetical protein [Ignavibacteria bacterium CHB1]MEB2330372.1 hypothetical protein [Ignavibacteriaceae bacterium]OQY76863.1 MAG: hypothetical protein B6D43_0
MNYIDIIKLFVQHKKVFIINTTIAIILSVIVTLFVMDEIFKSTSLIKSSSQSTGLGALLGQGVPDIGGLEDLSGGIGGGASAKELALYENILFSRKVIEQTITRFNLMEEYDYEKLDDAIKFFREEILEVEINKMAGTMDIAVFDKSPEKAKEMNEFLIELLNIVNIDLNVNKAKSNREFIQSRYDLAKVNLTNAEDSLKFYQEIFGVAPDLQIKATVQAELELEVQIKTEEVKLEVLRKFLSPGEAEIITQEKKIEALYQKLNEIKSTEYGAEDFGLKGAPDVAMNYLRLTRNLEIQNKILAFLLPLLEQAKIEENRKTPTLLIIDPPSLPDKKAKPKRSIIVILSTLTAVLFTFSFFLLKQKWTELRDKINS